MGARAGRQRRPPAAAHRRRRRAAADRLRAAGRLGAGQVVHPARRPLRGDRADDRDRAGRRRATTPSDCCAPPARASPRGRARSRSGRPSGLALDAVDVPGDISSAAPFLVAATLLAESRLFVRGMSTQPDAHRPADGARAHGRAHQPLQPPHDRRAASRSPTSRCIPPSSSRPRSSPRSCRALIDELPLLALGGDDGARPHASCAARASCASRSRTASRPSRSCCARSAATCTRPPTAGRSRACRARPEGGRVDAHGDHRIGMLGAVAGLVSRDGVRIDGLPRRSASRTPGFAAEVERLAVRPMVIAIDGPAGAGKSTVARAVAERARLPLARHRRDVPRGHARRAARRRRERRRRGPRRARRPGGDA